MSCSICLEGFDSPQNQIVFPGHESHPFHPHCIKTWVQINPICPNDRKPIDPNDLLSRTEKVVRKLEEAGWSVVGAGSLFAATSAVGWLIAGIPGAAAMAIGTSISVAGRASAEEAEKKAEDDDEAAADALADAEAAGIIARETNSKEALAIAREKGVQLSALEARAEASEEKAKKASQSAEQAEQVGIFWVGATAFFSGSLYSAGALTGACVIAREVSEIVFKKMGASLTDRRISGSACALGGMAMTLFSTEPKMALGLGALVLATTAVFSSLITRRSGS